MNESRHVAPKNMLHTDESIRRLRVSPVLSDRMLGCTFMALHRAFENYQGKKTNLPETQTLTANMGNLMSALCGPCRAIVDENPLCVLFRRDGGGNYILCPSCRKSIWRANENARNGLVDFNYSNPGASSAQTHSASSHLDFQRTAAARPPAGTPSGDAMPDTWDCTRCGTLINARPRAYLGTHVPKGWWWCWKCQAEAKNDEQGHPHRQAEVAPEGRACKKQKTADMQARAPSAQGQLLEKWLVKP